jgi:hypothetical protein
VAKRGNAPTKAELEALAAHLRPGQRVTVGTGITLTTDGSGRLRFQWRERLGGRGTRQAGNTCETYADAKTERDSFLERKNDSTGAPPLERAVYRVSSTGASDFDHTSIERGSDGGLRTRRPEPHR